MLYLFTTCILTLVGCSRCPLEEMPLAPQYAEIVVEFDWIHLGVQPGGMSAVFYPTDGGAPIVHKTGENISVIRLPLGRYNIVAFNYSFSEFDGIRFRGTDQYETIEAYANPLPEVTISKITKVKDMVEHPDILAVSRKEGFEVTDQMVQQTQQAINNKTNETIRPRLIFTPVKVVAPGYVTVHLNGLNYIRSAKGVISGLASSLFLGSGQTANPASLLFNFTTPTYYPGSKLNGHVFGQFTSFGLLTSEEGVLSPCDFLFAAQLIDKEQTPFEVPFEVTDRLQQEIDPNLNILLRLDLELGLSQTPGDDTPTIKVPQVAAEAGGGFDVDIGSWDDEDFVDLPVQ